MKKNDRDAARKRYFKRKERLADLINILLRLTQEEHGEQEYRTERVKAEDFAEINPELCATEMRQEGKYSRRRIVDGAYLIKTGKGQCCLFLEHQELTNYRMPERVLSAESIWYHETANSFLRKHQSEKDLRDSGEQMGGFAEADRLIPVFTVVIYYGTAAWKGAGDLHGILNMEEVPEAVKKLVNNYETHIVEVCRFEHLEWFETDLRETFGFIKYADEEEKLREFVEQHREVFESLSEDAYDFITFQTGTRKLERFKKEYRKEEGEVYNMCKAIDDMEKHAEERGRKLGEKRGEERLEELMRRLLEEKRFEDAQKVVSNRTYRGRLYQKYNIK